MENLFVALTNFPIVLPLRAALKNRDYVTVFTVGFVGVASFLSHLVENHKHEMPGFLSLFGIDFPLEWSYGLNRCDVLGVILVSLRFGQIYHQRFGWCFRPIIQKGCLVKWVFAVCLNLFSEHGTELKWVYLITHCAWHFWVFVLMEEFYYLVSRRGQRPSP